MVQVQKAQKVATSIWIYIRDAKFEIVLPPFDDISESARSIAETLIKKWPNDLIAAAKRNDEAGIFDGPLKRSRFRITLTVNNEPDVHALASALEGLLRHKGNHEPRPLTTPQLMLI